MLPGISIVLSLDSYFQKRCKTWQLSTVVQITPRRRPSTLPNRSDNPRYSVGIGQPLRHLTEQERQRLMDKAHELSKELVNDPEAQARSDELKGL